MKINQVTREVSVTINGADFRFRPSCAGLSDWEASCNDTEVAQLWLKATRGHVGTTIAGLKSLCVEGPIDDLLKGDFSAEFVDVLTKTVEIAFPIAGDDDALDEGTSGNVGAAKTA